jgi:hypothetical protein
MVLVKISMNPHHGPAFRLTQGPWINDNRHNRQATLQEGMVAVNGLHEPADDLFFSFLHGFVTNQLAFLSSGNDRIKSIKTQRWIGVFCQTNQNSSCPIQNGSLPLFLPVVGPCSLLAVASKMG